MEEKVDIVALGELLIDFTEAGHSQDGRKLFEQNPGGAPANQDFSMDNGLVCRWMTGQTKISPKISAYYSKPSNQRKLAHMFNAWNGSRLLQKAISNNRKYLRSD